MSQTGPAKSPKKIVVIRNPVAGQRKWPFVMAVIEKLKAEGAEVEVRDTEFAGQGELLARQCVAEKWTDLIVASGGDGSIREVASGMHGTSIPLGIIPAGTANVLARELGYLKGGKASVFQTVHILLGQHVSPLYPFEVVFGQARRLGLCWLGAGFDAEVLNHVKSGWKDRVGRVAFVPAFLRALAREHKELSIPWCVGDAPTQACGWAILSNVQRYAGPFKLTQKTSASERGLACLMFPKGGVFARMKEQVQIIFRPLDTIAKTRHLHEGVLTVGSDGTPLQLDGDFLGRGQATITPLAVPLYIKSAP